MLNGIWGFFVIGGILTGAFLGRMDGVTQAVIGGGKTAMELAFAMAGVVAVWSGILKIAEKGGMIDALAGKMEPLMDILFPSVPRHHTDGDVLPPDRVGKIHRNLGKFFPESDQLLLVARPKALAQGSKADRLQKVRLSLRVVAD